MMAKTRIRRIKYYNVFSYFYDVFINLHSGRDKDTTRSFLINCAGLSDTVRPRILDVCCGTGSVLMSFIARIPTEMAIGCDFSSGMLKKAREKIYTHPCVLIESDATQLPFNDNSFDIVTCSHALYELKGQHRKRALLEMKRVICTDGVVLIMEHEVPQHPIARILFNIRMAAMGSEDAQEFVDAGEKPYNVLFSNVTMSHTTSGKSKVFICRK